MPIERDIASTISSIAKLQGTCNFFENRFTVKLVSLEATEFSDGEKVTRAKFEEATNNFHDVGKLRIEEFSQSRKAEAQIKDATAFILRVSTKLLLFRNE